MIVLNTMTLYDFNKLDLNGRMEAVNQYGIFLDNYIKEDTRINCYAINMFFVEVYYDSKSNKITDIQSFKTGHSLDKYSNI